MSGPIDATGYLNASISLSTCANYNMSTGNMIKLGFLKN